MPFDLASAIGGAAVSAAFGGAGFWLKRYFSGDADREKATLFSTHADIAAKLKAEGLSIDEVDNIAAMLKQRRKAKKAQDPVEPFAMSPYWTQSAMNIRAHGAAEVAEAKLKSALSELSSIITKEETDALDEAQNAWVEFVRLQETFAGLQVSGGTMEPLIRSFEHETLANQRLAAVKAMIEERKKGA